jgi:hypothetical protein
MASGQTAWRSVFQVGGNLGSSSPLLAAFVVVPHGQRAWPGAR